MLIVKRIISAAALSVAVAAVPVAAAAQDFPDKAIRLIVPFAPGGGGDQLVLTFIDELSRELGQPILKENHGGGNSVIGTNLLSTAPADGYTIGVVTTGFAANPYLYKSLPYDTHNDFVPVSVLVAYPFVMAVRSEFPAESVEEFIAYAKANPGEITNANSGRGAGAEFAAGLLSSLADIEFRYVAFQGAGPGMAAVAGGFVDFIFSNLASVTPFVESGNMRVLGHTGTVPFGDPELEPLADQGVPGYEFLQWWAVLAPAGTPDEAVERLHEAFVAVFDDPAVRGRMEQVNAEFIVNTPEEARAYIENQSQVLQQIVDVLGHEPE